MNINDREKGFSQNWPTAHRNPIWLKLATLAASSVLVAMASAQTPTRVQSVQLAPSGNVISTATATWAKAPADGDTLILEVCYNDGNQNLITGITEAGCTWRRLASGVNHSGSELWVASGVQSAGSTITVTGASSYEQLGFLAVEYSGVGSVDHVATSSGTGSPLSSGSATVSKANEMCVTAFFSYCYDASTYSSPTNGYSIAAQTKSQYPLCFCDQYVKTAGTTTSAIATNGPSPYLGYTVSFTNSAVNLNCAQLAANQARISWTTIGSGGTVELMASRTPSMSNATLVATTAQAQGSMQVASNPWQPTYYQAQLIQNGVVTETSNVTLSFNNALSTNPWAGVETVAFWYEGWVPSTSSGSTLSKIGNPGYVVTTPSSTSIADCKTHGIGILPYNTFYQTQNWAPVLNSSMTAAQIAAAVGGIGFQKSNGFVPSIYTSDYAATDPNSVTYRNQVSSYITQQMPQLNGTFVDNGYPDTTLIDLVPTSTYHSEAVPSETVGTAYEDLLLTAVAQIKTVNPKNMVILNGPVGNVLDAGYYGIHMSDIVDGFLWENFMYAPNSAVANWAQTYQVACQDEQSNLSKHAKWFVLAYPTSIEQNLYAYATAKLCNMAYSADLGVNGDAGHNGSWPTVNNLRLGAPVDAVVGGHKWGNVYYRQYQNGFVLVNPYPHMQAVMLPMNLRKNCVDFYTGKSIVTKLQPEVTLLPGCGRVYLWN